MNPLRWLCIIVVLVGTSASCAHSDDMNIDPGVSAGDIRQRTRLIIDEVVASAPPSINTFTQGPAWDALAATLTRFLGVFSTVPSLVPQSMSSAATNSLTGTCDGGSCGFSPAQTLDAVGDFLADGIFTDANLESNDRTSAVFLMRGKTICGALVSCQQPTCDPKTTAGCDPQACARAADSCAKGIDAVELRIKARLVDKNGLDIELSIGPNKARPVLLALRRGSAALEFDLSFAKAAVDHLQRISGAAATQVATARGRMRFEIKANGPQDVSVLQSVLETIELQVSVKQGPIRLTIAAANPFLEIRAQTDLHHLVLKANAGALDFSVPYAALTPKGEGSGTVQLHSDGQSWAIDLSPQQQTLSITDIGMGAHTSTLSKDGAPLMAFDLNAASGRKFDLTLAADPSGRMLFVVQPELHFRAMFDFQLLAGEFPQIAPFLQHETYEISLRGPGRGEVMPIGGSDAQWDAGLKVVTGTLSMTSLVKPNSLIVGQGQCLNFSAATATELAPNMAVETCP